jgi:hypothetical protein
MGSFFSYLWWFNFRISKLFFDQQVKVIALLLFFLIIKIKKDFFIIYSENNCVNQFLYDRVYFYSITNISQRRGLMNKRFNKYSLILGVVASLSLQQVSAHVSYIPHDLKQCVHAAARVAGRGKAINLQELDAMINEGRIIVSESTMRKALNEALDILENNSSAAYQNVVAYLEEYLEGLNNRSIVLSLQGDNEFLSLLPVGMIAGALNTHVQGVDMMRISTEVAARQNLDVSGAADVTAGDALQGLALLAEAADANMWNTKASIAFNANMMSNVVSATPNMIFGTGVASPSINAWIMAPSVASAQSPINIQFTIPADYKRDKPVSLELHFLISNQGEATADARIQVKAEYLKEGDSFNINASNPSFDQTIKSDNFRINEPNSVNSVKYVMVTIPLDKDVIAKHKFALYSLSRIAPNHGRDEYMGDIFLAAATFKYVAKNYA